MQLRRVSLSAVAALAILAIALPAAAAQDVAGLIKRQSQEFSDASASGDVSVLGKYLDDRVVFINESGDIATKKDILSSSSPPPPGASNTLVQKNFHVELHGNVAVTSFTDEATVHFHGQRFIADFLSTEVWLSEPSGWKMISSQTLAVNNDPPAITLPAATLDEYVGTYHAGPGYDVKITSDGSHLMASANGGPTVALFAEVRDVFFLAGDPRGRRIFSRDANGAITGYVSRREGHDIVLTRTSGAG